MRNISWLFIILLSLFSCKEEEESITFHMRPGNHYEDFTYMSLEYSVIAPGRVVIYDHGVIYKDFMGIHEGRVSFGSLNSPGSYHNYVDGLQPGNSYTIQLYARTKGGEYIAPDFSVSMQGTMP